MSGTDFRDFVAFICMTNLTYILSTTVSFMVIMDNSSDLSYIKNDSYFVMEKPGAFQVFVMYTISILCMLLNIVVFVIVPRTKSLFKEATGVAMINLAVTDFLLGLSCFVLITLLMYSPSVLNTGTVLCSVNGVTNPLLASVSILTLTFINVDKFLTLKYPLHYKAHMSPKRATIIIMAIWVAMVMLYIVAWIPGSRINIKLYTAAYLCIVDFTSTAVYTFVIIALVQVLPTAVCILSFVAIYWIIRKRKTEEENLLAGQNRDVTKQMKSDKKFILTLFLMTSSYYVMWTPFFICVVFWELFTGHTLSPTSDFITVWFGGSNSFVNSLIYIPTLRYYRMELIKCLRAVACSPKCLPSCVPANEQDVSLSDMSSTGLKTSKMPKTTETGLKDFS